MVNMMISNGGGPTLFNAFGAIAVGIGVADGVADPAVDDADAAAQEPAIGTAPADGSIEGVVANRAVVFAHRPAAFAGDVVLI